MSNVTWGWHHNCNCRPKTKNGGQWLCIFM